MKHLMLILAVLVALIAVVSQTMDWNPLRTADDSSGETVVILHGLGRSNLVTKTLSKRLFESGYNIQQVEYHSLFGDTREEVLKEVTDQINACCSKLTTPVHFVGHSLGGLLVRAYLGEQSLPKLGNVILLGSPSKGTPVVDSLKGEWLLNIAGEMTQALGTDDISGFLSSLPAPTYPLGVIAGAIDDERSKEIPGDDDGLVSVESTKVDGMSDFIVLPVSHSDMRNDEAVFAQIIHFLKGGKFDHKTAAK